MKPHLATSYLGKAKCAISSMHFFDFYAGGQQLLICQYGVFGVWLPRTAKIINKWLALQGNNECWSGLQREAGDDKKLFNIQLCVALFYMKKWFPLLLKLALLPGVFLFLALPGKVVVVLATLHQRDEVVSTVVTEVERHFGFCHLFSCHLHLWTGIHVCVVIL